jgi:SNF2 family DNA or RNA helicase/DNA-directed RNA polymerase subunit RPC12/RpoP
MCDEDFFAELDRLSSQSLNQRMDSYMISQRTEGGAAPPPAVAAPSVATGAEARRKRRRDEAVTASQPLPPAAAPAPTDGPTWTCSLCTLINECAVTECAACGQAKQASSAVWVCSSCSAVNPHAPDQPQRQPLRCAHCRSRRIDAPPPAAAVAEQVVVQGHGGVRAPLLLDDDSGVVEVEAPAAVPPAHEEESQDAHDEDDDVPFEDEEEEQEEYEESETESDDADDDDDGSPIAARRRRGGSSAAAVGSAARHDKDLVEFLQELPTVPFEQLPHAAPPASMARGPALRPFQLQGLYWMLQREGHPSAPAVPLGTPHHGTPDFLDELLREDALTPHSNRPVSSSAWSVDRVLDAPISLRNPQAPKPPKYYSRGGILADYMGLGKTKMLISLCEAAKAPRQDRLEYGRVGSSATIIVCPMSLMSQWVREIAASVYPPPRVLRYYGANRKHKSIFQIAQEFDYVITSFQTLSREPCDGAQPPSKLRMIYWHRAIVDEAHYTRNPRSVQSRAVTTTLDAKYRWAVTATPLQNRLNDLFPLLNFLRVPHFRDAQWWNATIAGPLGSDPNDQRAVAALQLLFSSLMLRRLPSSTVNGVPILNLPPKQVNVMEVTLNNDEREFYTALHLSAAERVKAATRRMGGAHALRAYSTAFEMLVRCRQCCLHPLIVVRALMQKAADQGLDDKSLLPQTAAPANGGATAADLDAFLREMKQKLRTEASAFAQSALDGVANQEELRKTECVICFDVMRKPVILRCAHMFCEECLVNALPTTHNRCPLCKVAVKKGDATLVPEVEVTAAISITQLADRALVVDHSKWPISSKAQAILDMVRGAGEDEKVIVFSHFTTFLKYMETVLNAHQISCATYTGDLSAARRDDVVTRFTKKTNPKVLLATITACGVGINLTRASQCIIADPSWNPGVEEQAMNRLHRIGQQRAVTITRLLAPDTVDVNIDELAQFKQKLTRYCFGGREGETSGNGRLGKQELIAMFTTPLRPQPNDGETRSAATAPAATR